MRSAIWSSNQIFEEEGGQLKKIVYINFNGKKCPYSTVSIPPLAVYAAGYILKSH